MATKSQNGALKKPAMTLKERRNAKRAKASESVEDIPRRKPAAR